MVEVTNAQIESVLQDDSFGDFDREIQQYIDMVRINERLIADEKKVIENMKLRIAGFERNIDDAKAGIIKLMDDNGVRSTQQCYFKATPKSVVILDEKLLKDEFIRIKREPDKIAIKKAIDDGKTVDGAQLSNGGETLVIK